MQHDRVHYITMNTTTEEPIWINTSPRLSFSQCLAQPGNPLPPPKPLDSPNPDFDFKVNAENFQRTQDPAHADELFFKGIILPLPLKTLNPNPDLDPIASPFNEKISEKKSFWKFGRSASFNCAGSGLMKSSFLRSYSAGTNTKTKTDLKLPQPSSLSKKKKKKKMKGWSDKDELSRASHVPMFPEEKGLIKILLCSCIGSGSSRITECQ